MSPEWAAPTLPVIQTLEATTTLLALSQRANQAEGMGTLNPEWAPRGSRDTREASWTVGKAKVTALQREVITSCDGPQLGARPFPTSGHARVAQQRALLKRKDVCRLGTHSWTADAGLLWGNQGNPAAGEIEAQ